MAEFCRKCNGRIAIDVDCPHTAGDRVAAVVDRNGSVEPPETVAQDIVERLRDRAGTWLDHCYDDADLDRDAANEIERLRQICAGLAHENVCQGCDSCGDGLNAWIDYLEEFNYE